ncbi:MAG: hypothetical protein UV40_C0033G0009 [Parcubacteria group bacterium GW2011_GWA1_42_7]|nr:MAG: hypothetical protein UV34_C0036G0005 [Parcubacteria group bacterium GW2011_GWB1_42_6]KKS69122.1 MAG: hypothetical protein UV40_C0033G0009 [Parcubacteria group bacterium GW2011_GWA1_42_7]KKS92239.1 MAG: hypothetical protein UV67_C0007G0005 [Parcubacteria group bacterium GW2011_GWC1_43_12]
MSKKVKSFWGVVMGFAIATFGIILIVIDASPEISFSFSKNPIFISCALLLAAGAAIAIFRIR